MQPGEYALINCRTGAGTGASTGTRSDHGKLFVAYSDPDLGHATNLRFICNITGPSNLLNQSFRLSEDKIIPIYDGTKQALADVKDEELASDFYSPGGKTNKVSCLSVSDGQVYLYFDSKGYIRWVNSNKAHEEEMEALASATTATSDTTIQPLVQQVQERVEEPDAVAEPEVETSATVEVEPEPEPVEPPTTVVEEPETPSTKINTIPAILPRKVQLKVQPKVQQKVQIKPMLKATLKATFKPTLKATPLISPKTIPIISRK